MTSLEQLVQDWLNLDKSEATRSEILGLWESGNHQELESRLRKRIEFGTAGLRGRMGAGFSRMNDLTVIQASQGLCAYVLKTVDNMTHRGVVVGHDHRYHSERWAALTAAAFLAKGVKVYLLRGLVHTPLVPFSVGTLRAACGVMITASHNPKQDNGYKVYWENAVQIIDPHDSGIAGNILLNLIPDERLWDPETLLVSSDCVDRTKELTQAYFEYISGLQTKNRGLFPPVKFVNTSMHGVSSPFIRRGMVVFGFPEQAVIEVAEQKDPDPEFPTDLALSTANHHHVRYVLAQDPDSDRFAAAENFDDGTWKVFTGDQLGAVFAAWVLRAWKASGKPLEKLAMVASTVSSKMVQRMALQEGFTFVECLTGFKYIGNTALDLVAQGFEVPFGYEEAIGFMFGSQIRDKDGVAATLVFAEMVASLHRSGQTVRGFLGELYQTYGYFQVKYLVAAFPLNPNPSQTSNGYLVCHDPVVVERIFSRLRSYNGTGNQNYPSELANLTVTSVRDLTVGYDSSNPPSFKPTLPLSSGNMITFRAKDETAGQEVVLTIRTSGTEPKIKYYLEGQGKDGTSLTTLLGKVVHALQEDWLGATKNNLLYPA
ncbi:hypothetical protein BDM02DRAFT_3188473 [Thelephora ganbajun]|uniref:Uncharacterized protein n=1 Tax=Thelephora ganbajun TaxID=370292 RepID=A0ACB6ZB43_THEGA|nr:hypothetical protein BDM02DRAFT_3188473 [Thelephora ganbajun]